MNTTTLNQTQIALKFKTLFENQKREILHTHLVSKEDLTIKPDDLRDEMDLVSSETEQQIRIKLRSREASMLKKIDQALLKIKDGTFGVCQCCEEPIELSRLEVRPIAELCLSCKENEESLENKSASGKFVRRIA